MGKENSKEDIQICQTKVPKNPLDNEPKKRKSLCFKNPVTLSLIKLWVAMLLTLAFSIALVITSHVTHSLTLRIEAYHSLYNLLSLIGCIVTMKLCQREKSIKNTFGWARLELVLTLCTLLFLCALCFGVFIDSIQTMSHAGHVKDAMHYPVRIIILGGIGLCLNSVIFFLIGGYTLHQGCLLERTNTGMFEQYETETHDCSLSKPNSEKRFQGLRGTLRDICGLVMVIICAALVFWDEGKTLALYVDPAFAISSALILLVLSYPYGKECSEILLQTIPAHIDVQDFSGRLLRKFPEVVNLHHLHIWSLTPGTVIATVHVMFENPSVYKLISKDLEKFFREEEITNVTLQPEFLSLIVRPSTIYEEGSCQCLLQCQADDCQNKNCCQGASFVAVNDTKNNSYKRGKRGRYTESAFRVTVDADMSTSAYRTSNISLPCQKNPETLEESLRKLSNSSANLCKSPEKSSFISLPEGSARLSISSGRIGEFFAAFQKL